MSDRTKHLEFIQETIKRLSGNSFLLRGWSVTLIIATITLASHSGNPKYLFISIFIAFLFWSLDAYYLLQERKFRCLYDHVRRKDESDIDFSMKPIKNHCDKCNLYSSVKSPIFLIFYGSVSLVILLILMFTYLDVIITLK